MLSLRFCAYTSSHFSHALLTFCLVALPLFCACSPDRNRGGETAGGNASGGGAVRVAGGGATFPAPLYQKWLSEYGNVAPNSRLDYQATGSSAGINGLLDGTIDFGGTDAPMNDDALAKASSPILHIPTVLGAVVVTYNPATSNQQLRFSPETLASIFLGKITRWNDAAIRADNPGTNLPDAEIAVISRSDGSGTSNVFTDYLSKVSSEFKQQVGTTTAPRFPVGQGAKGNDGVTAQIQQTPNTIGYVELVYAKRNNLPIALIKNSAGNFVEPSLESVGAAAAESLPTTPEDLRVSITNAGGANAYPIASYTYILLYQNQKDAAKGKAVVDFLWWGLHDGANFARELNYAPLPPAILARAEAKLNSVAANNQLLRQQ